MPNYNQVTGVAIEQAGAITRTKRFFRRFAERIGLEVAEYRGKTLSEMAKMTSKKDAVILRGLSENETKISEMVEKYKQLNDELQKLKDMPEYRDWLGGKKSREKLEAEIKELEIEIEREERGIQWHKEYLQKPDYGYSPDGDHVYGSSSGLSGDYLSNIIRKEREEKVEPLQKELQVLLEKRAVFDKLNWKVPYLREQLYDLGKQISTEIESYRSLSISQGVQAQRIDDYVQKYWNYYCGMVRLN